MFRPVGCGPEKQVPESTEADVVCAPTILAEYSHELPTTEPRFHPFRASQNVGLV